jgi:hypothetical protein
MTISIRNRRWLALLATVFVFHIATPRVEAQFAIGGVYIDAEGVLRQASTLEADSRLELLRAEAVGQASSGEMAQQSSLRRVSLARLQAVVRDLQQQGKPLPPEIRYVGGINQITHIFFYPDRSDVVIAGPAEGWKQLPTGEVVGIKSNRPVIHLDDLIVALRYAFDAQKTAPFIGCSIDPTQQGVNNYAAYMKRLRGIDRSRLKQIFGGMEQAMGMQSIRLFGIPGSSRFALKMVAADYRLKRIALGHDPAPVKRVVSYLDLAARRSSPDRRQHRWWFVGDFDAIVHSPDKLAYELQGQGVKVVTATTNPGAAQQNGKEAKPSIPASQFAQSFSKNFDLIATKIPVFAELRNLITLSVVAELIAEHSRSENGKSAWKPTHFANAKECAIGTYATPTQVPSIANFRFGRARFWVISVSGGVEINPRSLLQTRKEATRGMVASARTKSRSENDRWWW